MTEAKRDVWQRGSKIPWNDPAFSQRMLAEHLSQDHDMASRRTEWIDQQVGWIHRDWLAGKPARLLDLGCGPGLYANRLAALGHTVRGIDFGPASIVYAQRQNANPARCEFVLGDLREVDFSGLYDLAMMLFGEFNTFSPEDIAVILDKARQSLAEGGRLICELQTAAGVEQCGHEAAQTQTRESGLFSAHPHTYRTENQWLADPRVAVQTITITEQNGEKSKIYHSTAKAWPDDELTGLFETAGFSNVKRCTAWPSDTDGLELWIAQT